MKSLHEALNIIKNIVKPLDKIEELELHDALGFVCSKDIMCKKNLPSFNNSALDGYAFKYEQKDNALKIKSTILAGQNPTSQLGLNECYKIMTGAKVPKDADTIVPFEQAKIEDGKLILPKDIKKHNAFRFKGEEAKKGEVLLRKGEILKSSHIMLLASQGIMNIEVFTKPNIAILSTGSELVEPWEECEEDKIYNANASGIKALLKEFGFDATYVGVVPDEFDKSVEFFNTLSTKYELILSSAGVSKGEADFVYDALKKNGFKEAFYGVNIKPGKPVLLGHMGQSLVISLPGNPAASYLTAFVFVLPALAYLSNNKNEIFTKLKVKNKKALKLRPNRSNIVLGKCEGGYFHSTNDNKNPSGMISPLLSSNCIFISDENTSLLKKDEELKIILFKE